VAAERHYDSLSLNTTTVLFSVVGRRILVHHQLNDLLLQQARSRVVSVLRWLRRVGVFDLREGGIGRGKRVHGGIGVATVAHIDVALQVETDEVVKTRGIDSWA